MNLFQLLNGLTFAALLFVVASGFTLIFGLLRVVNLANAGLLHDVFRGGVDTRLALSDAPIVNAANPARGLFVIGTNGTVQAERESRVYTQLGNYQAALQANLAAGLEARSFVASGGTYLDGPKTLTANLMATALQ